MSWGFKKGTLSLGLGFWDAAKGEKREEEPSEGPIRLCWQRLDLSVLLRILFL